MGEYVTNFRGRTIYKRTPEEIAAAKAAKAAKAMHCQCCGRAIFAQTGTIAHHGYERPGTGWQTASCFGAKFEPWEAGRERLAAMITSLKAHLSHLRKTRAKIEAEEYGFEFRYTKRRGMGYRDEVNFVDVSRAEWNVVWPAYEREMRMNSIRSFEDVKDRELADVNYKMKRTRESIAQAEKRYASWKRTHRWDAKSKTWKEI